jgi:hypothetical protein
MDYPLHHPAREYNTERRVSRDEFALAAMVAIIAKASIREFDSDPGSLARIDSIASGAYAYADAMISERDKKP